MIGSSPQATGAQPILAACDIHKEIEWGNTTLSILRGVSLEVQAGEIVAINGPSGSGKSTLLGILGGLDRPSAGSVHIAGRDITQLDEDELAAVRNQLVGFVFQFFNLMPTLTALENVELPLCLSNKPTFPPNRAREVLESMGLGHRLHHRPFELSGGEQQRVAIARALVNDPTIVLADEPTGNLDSASTKDLTALLLSLRERLGTTVLLVTHDPQVASVADRILHLTDGHLIEPR